MTRVKVCGITSPEDALMAAEAGAAAIGLVFWPASPRCVDERRAAEIVAALPPLVGAVGVFVNQVADAAALAARLRLAAVQFHGDEAVEDYREFPCAVIKAVPVRDASARAAAAAVPPGVTVLLDAHDPIRRGGTGAVVDWAVARAIARERPVILSGGLTAANVRAAVEAVQPAALDVSSGVESAPGVKDRAKLRAWFAALRG